MRLTDLPFDVLSNHIVPYLGTVDVLNFRLASRKLRDCSWGYAFNITVNAGSSTDDSNALHMVVGSRISPQMMQFVSNFPRSTLRVHGFDQSRFLLLRPVFPALTRFHFVFEYGDAGLITKLFDSLPATTCAFTVDVAKTRSLFNDFDVDACLGACTRFFARAAASLQELCFISGVPRAMYARAAFWSALSQCTALTKPAVASARFGANLCRWQHCCAVGAVARAAVCFLWQG